jgi:hypothetical protein
MLLMLAELLKFIFKIFHCQNTDYWADDTIDTRYDTRNVAIKNI